MTFRTRILAAACAIATPAALAQTTPTATTLVTSPAPAAFDPAIAKDTVTTLAAELEKGFLYPDVGKAYSVMLRQNLAAGRYASFADATAFANRVTADLQAVHADGHLRLRAPGDGPTRRAPPAAGAAATPAPTGRPPLMEQAGWIAPGIAYVRFNAFMGDPRVLADFTAFLDSHADAKALIIDARTHGGGGLSEMDVLFPRIFDKPQTVMVMDTRASVAEAQGDLPFASLVKVAGTAEISRAEHRVTPRTPVSGLAKTHIYYLTAGRTASAAEHLASVFKYTKRATLIGDTTAGAGNYGGGVELPGGYSVFIPAGHSYFPGTKGWEGTGVEPDVKVAPERALIEALTREGVPAAEAETLSASHMPSGSMARRVMPRN